jgi:hypothetical protein
MFVLKPNQKFPYEFLKVGRHLCIGNRFLKTKLKHVKDKKSLPKQKPKKEDEAVNVSLLKYVVKALIITYTITMPLEATERNNC